SDRHLPGRPEDHLIRTAATPAPGSQARISTVMIIGETQMAEVLVLVEHADGAIKKVSTELLTAARSLGTPAAVVLGPAGTGDKLAVAVTAAGAEMIYVGESEAVDGFLVTPKVDVLAGLAEQAAPAAIQLAATAEGKEVAG